MKVELLISAFLAYIAPPLLEVLLVNSEPVISAILPYKDIAPPFGALLLLNSQPITVKFETDIAPPSVSVALLFSNLEFLTIVLLWLDIAPPKSFA